MSRNNRTNRMDQIVQNQAATAAATEAERKHRFAQMQAQQIAQARLGLKRTVPLLIQRLDELGAPNATMATLYKEKRSIFGFKAGIEVIQRAAWKLHDFEYTVPRGDIPSTGHMYILSNGMLCAETSLFHEVSIDNCRDPVRALRGVEELILQYGAK